MQMLLLLISASVFAQTTVIVPAGNPAGTGSTASPQRKPLGSNRAYERSAMIYKQSEIAQLGIISSVAFFVDSLNAPGDAYARIFIKEVPDSTFGPTTVAAVESGATLVYDDTVFASQFVLGSWITIPLTTNFVHNSNTNIMVIVETNSGTPIGTDTNTVSKGFRYFATNGNAFQYWQSPTNSTAIPNANGITNINRPNIKFEITALQACIAPPNAGIVTSSNDSVCAGNIVNLSLTGADLGAGITYQWLSSADGANWTPITGQTNSTTNATINSSTFFTCVLTCTGISDTATAISIVQKSFYECYCNTNLGGNCTSSIDSVGISGTTLQNGASGCSNSYTLFPNSGNTTASLTQGNIYVLGTKYNGNTRTSLWIDYNHNGVFDNSEWTQVCTTSTAGVEVLSNFTIPFTALTGMTGMRIRSRAFNGQNDSTTACVNSGSGEIEDYMINIVQAANCIAPPTAGTTITSQDSVCTGNVVNLSLLGSTNGNGIFYQWIASNNGINWVPVVGANLSTFSPVIVSDSIFACVVTCAFQSDTSAAVNITLNSYLDCYCNTNLGGNCATTALDSIAIVSTTLANGPTGCAPTFYTAFPEAGTTTADLMQGQTYTVISKYNGVARAACWIDYDHNGIFDNNEWTNITNTSTAGVEITSLLQIPITASLGKTLMRVRTRATNGALDATQVCVAFGSGETEDYIINITAAPNCVAPPTPGVAVASQDSVCPGGIVNYILTGINVGIGQTFQWIASNDGANWVDLAGENGTTLSATINADSMFACIVTCSGLSDTSTAAMTYLNPFYKCYCNTNLGGNCNAAIDSVAISGTTGATLQNGPSGCTTGYTLFPISGNTTTNLVQSMTYGLATKFTASARVSMWIDYDQNGVFDSNEWAQVCTTSTAGVEVLTGFTIPPNAMTGLTGMRIRSRASNGANDSTSACTNFVSGETEDYIVNILAFVGVNNQYKQNSISVYPNPSNGNFTIQSNVKIKQVKIYDVCGKEIEFSINTINSNQSEIYLNHKGAYFIQITDNENGVKNHKIIVN